MSELVQVGAPKGRTRPPRPDELQLRFSKATVKELEALRTHYPEEKACIIPCLWMAQREYGGFLSEDAIAEVACRLNQSYAEVEGVATFYTMFNTAHQPGVHKIEVCTCLSCAVCGGYRVWDYLKSKLGVGHGETTADGMFTLEEVECLDACDRAPVLQIGDEYVGPVTTDDIDRILEELRASSISTVTKLADEIVKTHLTQAEYEAAQAAR